MKRTLPILLAVTVFSLAACQKAGLEGKNTLVLKPQHHGLAIKGSVAYIKFNVSELPDTASSAFDHVVRGSAGEDHIHVEGLKKGKYYVYCVGFDSAISQEVRGGVPVVINSKSGETEKEVPVTEAH
jgi:hypothetical protein